MHQKVWLFLVLLFSLSLTTACGSQQGSIQDRTALMGEFDTSSNFFEARQIAEIEDWKDVPGKIVNVYIINPVTGGLLIPPVQCKGVPASSTESLEPNHGLPYGFTTGSVWKVPLDGVDVGTDELAGRDGTFGEPVHFRQCMTVDGNYLDFPAYGLPYLVSSASYSFPDSTVKRDFETEARLLKAEEIIRRGGCINVETLEEISCDGGEK